MLHTEALTAEVHNLGQFFVELGRRPYGGVHGELFEDDPATIEIADDRETAIVIGAPPDEIPDSYDMPSM